MQPGQGKPTILIVEDDPGLALGLVDTLEFEGFDVVHSVSGGAAVKLAEARNFDCVILDVMLPDMNGFQVCTELRLVDPIIPILMLTARSQEMDKIRGLEAGADDYVTKPFSVGELVARIRALFRRAARAKGALAETPFRIGDATVNPATQLLERSGASEELSFYEVELLKLLNVRQGHPVSRDEILEKIWGISPQHTNRTVDNFIVKLRKKIEPTPDKPRHILTVYGVGYKLVP